MLQELLMPSDRQTETDAYVITETSRGITRSPVRIVEETDKGFRVKAIQFMELPDRRLLDINDEAFIPKYFVRFSE